MLIGFHRHAKSKPMSVVYIEINPSLSLLVADEIITNLLVWDHYKFLCRIVCHIHHNIPTHLLHIPDRRQMCTCPNINKKWMVNTELNCQYQNYVLNSKKSFHNYPMLKYNTWSPRILRQKLTAAIDWVFLGISKQCNVYSVVIPG